MYTGEWLDDLQHGHGVEIWPGIVQFTGSYLHGKRSGLGKMVWIDNSHYEGFWEDNMQQGHGIFEKNGRIYMGQYH